MFAAPAVPLLALCLAAAAAPADLATLVRDARSPDSSVRLPAYDALLALGPDGVAALEPILRDAEKKAAREFLAMATSPKAASFRASLKKDIAERRKLAIAIIQDEVKYPDDAHGEVGQPLVDGEVARLRELWLRPGRLFAERVPEIEAKLYFVKEAAETLKRAGLAPDTFDGLDEAWGELDAVFDVRGLMLGRDQKRADEIDEWNATCPGSATDEERRFARILNDYRVMLGLEPLEIDERLMQAARKHSQEMLDLDYFAHVSPVDENRTPSMRAAKEGFNGGVLENCAITQGAQGAFDGWYTSSGHHRALIAAGIRQIGIGQAVNADGSGANQWTFLGGSGNSLRGKKKGDDPRQLVAARRARLRDGDVETAFRLATFCMKNDMPEDARQLFEQVVRFDPKHKKAHELLGHVKSNGRWITLEQKLAEDLAGDAPEEALATLGKLVRSEAAAERVAAVRFVGALDEASPLVARALPLATAATKDGASEVRVAACEALALRAKSDGAAAAARPALAALLTDKSFYVRHAAARALFAFGDRSGTAALFAGLRSGDLNTRIDAHRKAAAVFGRDFGYAWDLPDVERAKVVDQWEAWVAEQAAGAAGAGNGR